MSNPPWLRSITAVPADCMRCGWAGLTGACESGAEGALCCPSCYQREVELHQVRIHYAPHERGIDPALYDSPIHAQVIDALKMQMLIVLVNRLGGKVNVPVPEVDATGQWVLGFSLEVVPVTGDKVTDATVGGVFHFETKKKQ